MKFWDSAIASGSSNREMSLLPERWLLSVLVLADSPRTVMIRRGTSSHQATRENLSIYPTSLRGDAMSSELIEWNGSKISHEQSHVFGAARNLAQYSLEEEVHGRHVASWETGSLLLLHTIPLQKKPRVLDWN